MSTDDIDTTTGIDDLDMIDDLPRPTRNALTFLSAHVAVIHAVKQALQAEPENQLAVLTRYMGAVLPVDPADNSLDAWARHGLFSGAQSAWDGGCRDYPRDLPNTAAHRQIYVGAHATAIMWVNAIRKDEGVRHGR